MTGVEIIPLAETNGDAKPAVTGTDSIKNVANGIASKLTNKSSITLPEFLNEDLPINQPRKLKIIQIGAGVSGIEMSHKIRSLLNVELKIYEKNSGLGGTWFENRYPGCASDIPGHIYCYTWEPNPNWSKLIVGSLEILQYLEHVVDKHDLRKYMSFNHQVVGATWIEKSAKWSVEITRQTPQGPVTFTDVADILISGTGILNVWKYPNVEGLKDYKGKLLHTANWDESFDWEGKTIATLGSGAFAVQVVPQLQKKIAAKKLDIYVRNPTWMTPDPWKRFGPEGMNKVYSEEERAHFGADPDFFLRYRKAVEGYFNGGWKTFYKGSAAQAEAQAGTLAHYQEIFHDETLRNFMTPSFGVGCRRPTTGDNFVRAMQEPNTTVFPFGVTKMNEDGIVHADGTVNKYDAIVCATGFDTSFTPRFPIHGRNGHELMEDFSKSSEAYLGLAVHGYPNFFMFSGPISPVGNGSAFPGAEGTAEYIAQFLKKYQKEGIRTFEIEQKPQDDFNDWVQSKMSKMVWTDNCDSWYKHPKTGKVQVTWPGSMLHYREAMADVHYEHFKLDYLSKNVFDWLGNGLTWSEVNDKHGDMAPYIT